ncbi:unnamed protein product [Phytophthora fragariaefolia]|uniref:Unnamed protein product n=1 Tax=Phytophthora fragariaefolia TaxID=1490495 RepID=A0A9W7CPQ5_9STRA|nr:unnamed protein product [Phytophthora fragariaefolia]
MALLQGDEDDKVFEATMSFIDEFSFDEPETEAAPTANIPAPKSPAQARTGLVHKSVNETKATAPCKVPSILSLDTTGMTWREKTIARNARKKLLRKAGIYGDSNRVRNERKLEIAYLRERIEDLQIDLKSLQTHKVGQREAKRRPANALHQVVHVLDFNGDISSFQRLFRHLEAAYRDIDAVFAANGLSSMTITPSDVHIRQGVGGRYLEVFSNKVLPFKLRDATEAAWNHFKGTDKHMGNGSLYTKAKRDLDEPYTIIEEFTKEVFSNSSRADVKMKQVVRRYVEPGRDIVIWVASVAPTEIKHKMLKGLTCPSCSSATSSLWTRTSRRGTAPTACEPSPTSSSSTQRRTCASTKAASRTASSTKQCDVSTTSANLQYMYMVHHRAANYSGRSAWYTCRRSGVHSLVCFAEPSTSFGGPHVATTVDGMAFFLDDEEDGRVLEAVLSFVDKFELGSLSAGSSRAEAVPLTRPLDANARDLTRRAVANAKTRILRKTGVYSDPNRARNERRREIARLREELEKLQLDLQNLQSRRAKSPQLQPRAMVNLLPQIPSLWQVVARKQRQRREEAERENGRLKTMVERQQKVAADLSSTLQKRARQLCSSFADVKPKQQIVHVVDFCGDIGDFDGLFRHLEAARREVDVVFAANGLEKMVITPCDVHIREGDEGKYLEAFSNKVLPFKLSDTAEVAWNHFKGVEKHLGNGSIYHKAAKAYTVIEAFTKEMHSNNSRADVKVKQVVRRYVEADHDLVIWVARVSPAEIRHKMLQGLTYHLRGYAKIKRSSASTPGREATKIESKMPWLSKRCVERWYSEYRGRSLVMDVSTWVGVLLRHNDAIGAQITTPSVAIQAPRVPDSPMSCLVEYGNDVVEAALYFLEDLLATPKH